MVICILSRYLSRYKYTTGSRMSRDDRIRILSIRPELEDFARPTTRLVSFRCPRVGYRAEHADIVLYFFHVRPARKRQIMYSHLHI